MQFLTITFRFEQGFHVKICGRKDYSKGVPLSLIWMFEWHECWNTHWLVMVRLSAWLSSKSRCSTNSEKRTIDEVRTRTLWQPVTKKKMCVNCTVLHVALVPPIRNLAKNPLPTFRLVFWLLLFLHCMHISNTQCCGAWCASQLLSCRNILKTCKFEKTDCTQLTQQISANIFVGGAQLSEIMPPQLNLGLNCQQKRQSFSEFNHGLFEFCGRSDVRTVENCHGAVSNGMAVTHKVPVKCLTEAVECYMASCDVCILGVAFRSPFGFPAWLQHVCCLQHFPGVWTNRHKNWLRGNISTWTCNIHVYTHTYNIYI